MYCSECDALIKAIDDYIKKVNDKLKKKLKQQGYKNVDETIEIANAIEDELSQMLKEQATSLADAMNESDSIEGFFKTEWPKIKASDVTDKTAGATFYAKLSDFIPKLTELYYKTVDSGVDIPSLTERTKNWMQSWSSELGEMMQLDSVEELENIIIDGIDNKKGISQVIQTIRDSGTREEYYQARRTAVTEVLRAHSVAQQEAYDLNPVIEEKEWKHCSSSNPRQNHLDMHGQRVPKNKPYTLKGADGITYYPMYPRDPILPAGESINCGCLSSAVANKDILGFSVEERKKMQAEARAEIDKEWKKDLDAKNKAKAGINEESIRIDWVKQKSKAGQIKYYGSKSRWALVESGVITKDSQMFKTVTTPKGKVTVKKTLKELNNSGIIAIDKHTGKKGKNVITLIHSTKGEFSSIANPKKPAGGKNGGNLVNGGHSQSNIEALKSKGIAYRIEKTYSNGVRIGGVENHTNKDKSLGTVGQAWFPENWSNDDVLLAGTYTANTSPKTRNDFIFANYKGVRVGVFIDSKGKVNTIFPDNSKQPWKGKWETTNVNRSK